jgi:WD40 repeat protein
VKGAYFAKISPRETYLASARIFAREISLWSINTGKVVRTLDGHEAGTYSVAFSGDESLLASLGNDGSVKIWDVVEEKVVAEKTISRKQLQNIQSLTGTSVVVQLGAGNGDVSITFKQP